VATTVIARRYCVQPLHEKRVNFYRGCFSQHFHGKDQPIKILLPYQDPLDSHQGATLDSHPLAALQEGMWLDSDTAFDNAPNGLDLDGRNSGRLARGGDKGMYPWRRHDVQPTLEAASQKDVAGEKR
jgi:hypothetical protein